MFLTQILYCNVLCLHQIKITCRPPFLYEFSKDLEVKVVSPNLILFSLMLTALPVSSICSIHTWFEVDHMGTCWENQTFILLCLKPLWRDNPAVLKDFAFFQIIWLPPPHTHTHNAAITKICTIICNLTTRYLACKDWTWWDNNLLRQYNLQLHFSSTAVRTF